MVTEAPAARALLHEATRRWPGRACASDGILSSDAHKKQNPTSRHDKGDAVDLTHDPRDGCDAHALAEQIRQRCIAGREDRVDEIISNGRIATAARGWRWRAYGGENPHDKHAHLSVRHERRNDTRPWFAFLDAPPNPTPKPRPPADDTDEDDMFIATADTGTAYLITNGCRFQLVSLVDKKAFVEAGIKEVELSDRQINVFPDGTKR